MRRRDFILGLGSSAAVPVVARAQQDDRVRRVAVLMGGSAADPLWRSYVSAFRKELTNFGWSEIHNLQTELRFGDSDATRMHAEAAELTRLTPDVVFTSSGAAARAAQRETYTIPIVGVGISTAMVKNIARPEGNLTGFPVLYPSIGSKWLELLKAAIPHLSRIGWVYSPQTNTPTGGDYVSDFRAAAKFSEVKIIDMPFSQVPEFDTFAAEPNGGIIVIPSAATATRDNRQSILLQATRYRLPVIHWDHAYPAEGGLMSYGSNFEDLHRQAASYVIVFSAARGSLICRCSIPRSSS